MGSSVAGAATYGPSLVPTLSCSSGSPRRAAIRGQRASGPCCCPPACVGSQRPPLSRSSALFS
eukprot:14138385-Alexandrium_andersonii.AAC.1